MSENDYIVEFVVLGKSVKATAIDPVTLKEASVIASTKTRKADLSKLAVRKLEYVINKEKEE